MTGGIRHVKKCPLKPAASTGVGSSEVTKDDETTAYGPQRLLDSTARKVILHTNMDRIPQKVTTLDRNAKKLEDFC